MDKKIIVKMLDDLCCSKCHCAFDEQSIEILREEDDLCVLHITCSNCNKSFGVAFLGINNCDLKSLHNVKDNDLRLKIDEDIPPINYDDVLDAHEYIKNLDKNWHDFMQEKNI